MDSIWSCSPETPNLGQYRRIFLSRVTLKSDEWPWKTIGHLFYATSSHVHHFVAICEFKLELWSKKAQICKICFDLSDLDLWSLTLTFAWTSHLSMVITPENSMMIRWTEHSASGFSDDQQDHQCLWFLSCCNATHLFYPHCLYSVWNKITTSSSEKGVTDRLLAGRTGGLNHS